MWQISIATTHTLAKGLSEALEPCMEVVTVFEEEGDPTLWTLRGICTQEPSFIDIEETVRLFAEGLGCKMPSLQIEQLPDRDWVAENRRSFPAFTCGPFYIYSSCVENPAWGDLIPLKIDASTAFGTGRHGTTAGCLELIGELHAQGIDMQTALDLGCGTGILGLAMARLFQREVLVNDNDPEATEKARLNAEINGLSSLVTVYTADGFDHPMLQKKSPYDLIVANILADPLIQLAPQMVAHVKPGGYIILSGILQEQAPKVCKAYVSLGMSCFKELLKQEWSTLLLRKNVK
jgi:ribosomal protein L11 methyltransferase